MEEQIYRYFPTVSLDPDLLRAPGRQYGFPFAAGGRSQDVELKSPAQLNKEAHLSHPSLHLWSKNNFSRAANKFSRRDKDFNRDALFLRSNPRNKMRNEDLLKCAAAV